MADDVTITVTNPNGAGRPQKEIDWRYVDTLLVTGCPGTDIADELQIHYITFYRRVEEKYGMKFTEYARSKLKRGDNLLRGKQFEKAMSKDNMMLIWLGKNRLDQSDAPAQKKPPNHGVVSNLLDEIKPLKNKIKEIEQAKSKLEDERSRCVDIVVNPNASPSDHSVVVVDEKNPI